MGMNITVNVEGKGIADLFRLECVRSLEKFKDGRLMVTVQTQRKEHRAVAFVGDKITYDSDNPEIGKVIRSNKNKNVRI